MQATRGWWVGLGTLFCATATAMAQDVETGLLEAELAIEAREWREALDLLLAVEKAATGDEALARVAKGFREVGEALLAARALADALRAREAALRVQLRRHGDDDHEDVLVERNDLAICLLWAGRPREALPQSEAAVALARRLFADRDHEGTAASLNNLASCLRGLGRVGDALPQFEAALAIWRRQLGADHPSVAVGENNVATCLKSLGRANEALPRYEAALAIWQRIGGGRDHPAVVAHLNGVADCLEVLGRPAESLARAEAALAMSRRLFGDRADPEAARSHYNVGVALESLGRADEALPRYEAALAMQKQLHGDADHPDVALCSNGLAVCLQSLGRSEDALRQFEATVAMTTRLYGDRDHLDVAAGIDNTASCLEAMGRFGEALPRHEAALAMRRRLLGDGDHPMVAASLSCVASSLGCLGRPDAALPYYEAALAMRQRLYAGRDHPDVALGLNNLAFGLLAVQRGEDALPYYEAALAMRQRLFAGRDHPMVAASHGNLGYCLDALGRTADAAAQYEAALAMQRRIFGDRDHPETATFLEHVGRCRVAAGRADEALPVFETSLAIKQRLYGDRDHPAVAAAAISLSQCLQMLGRDAEALPPAEQAAGMIERIRDDVRLSTESRQSLFDALKGGDTFESLQGLTARLGKPLDSLHACERARGRGLLDLMAQQGLDPFAEAERLALLRGDEAAAKRMRNVRSELDVVELEGDRILHRLSRLDAAAQAADHAVRRQELVAQSDAASQQRRRLLDERARLLGDVLPVGQVRTAAEIQASLRDGELFVEFTVTARWSGVYVLARNGDVAAVALPSAFATVQRLVPRLLQRTGADHGKARGRDPEGTAPALDTAAQELFASLFPAPVWDRIRAARRVFLSPHRSLHHLPFELLVTGSRDGKQVQWIDDGPPISYVPSGSALHWLRRRARDAADDATSLDLLAVGDPRAAAASPAAPAVAAAAGGDRVRRAGDVERLGQLPPLAEARAETEAIARVFAGKQAKTRVLLGAEATEPTVFDLAPKAKYLHFACHGIAEEYAGQSLSMLVLSQPEHVLPGDDGLLQLGDFFHAWRGRLRACRLVVLSACRTHVGPTLRDEAPQALPVGFLFAGASSVISSLWAVDDASTRALMTDFYGRLLAGATDRLAAFTAAKQALRAKYPDPFHWAPFLYLGSPD